MAARFPFTDLHSFKDYVVFVKMCAPDLFPEREGVGPENQWTLDLAFIGLRLGLEMAEKQKGQRPVFSDCARLVDEAERSYRAGDRRGGFTSLDNVRKLLGRVPSQ
jgi:hypothetical protein